MVDLVENAEPARANRPRWVLPVLTAVAMVLAGGGAVVATNAVRGGGPSVAGGRAAPIGGALPSPGSTAATQPAQSRSHDPKDSGPHPTDAQVGPATVTLPVGWRLRSVVTDDGRVSGCVDGPGTNDTGPCDIWIVALTELPPYWNMGVDQYRSFADAAVTTGNCLVATTAYATKRLDDRSAEYRSFSQACSKMTMDQWTVPTWPAVQFTVNGARPDLRTAADGIVSGARFTRPDSGKRVMDHGSLAGHSTVGNTERVRLDRSIRVFGGPDNGHDEDNNHTTYDYALAPGVAIEDRGQLCADSFTSVTRTCSLPVVFSRIDQGKAGAVTLRFDTRGTVVALVGEYRP